MLKIQSKSPVLFVIWSLDTLCGVTAEVVILAILLSTIYQQVLVIPEIPSSVSRLIPTVIIIAITNIATLKATSLILFVKFLYNKFWNRLDFPSCTEIIVADFSINLLWAILIFTAMVYIVTRRRSKVSSA